MSDDPSGLYARLKVHPAAPPEAITAAFRQMARVLHPDVAATGNAEAFMRVKEAYDVLGDAHRRAAYDRAARAAAAEEAVAPPPVAEPPATRGPRLSDLPMGLWAGLGGVAFIASVMALVQFNRPPPPPPPPVARPYAPSVPEPTPPPSPVASAVPAAGATTHYVVPAGGAAILWRHGASRDSYLPMGELPPFSAVRAVGVVAPHGLVEIRLADGGSGFVDAERLTPGDGTTAHRAYCAYNAGAMPENGEVLARRGAGPAHLQISNRAGEPAVVKLRDASGHSAATVFVAPGSTMIVANLPDGPYQPEFAIGELWSRACQDFAAGMRAQRFDGYRTVSGLSPLVIPPDLSARPAPVDIPDAAFERE